MIKLKRFTGIIILLLLALSITGCVSMTAHLTINMDGSADWDYSLMLDRSLVTLVGEGKDPFVDMKKNAESEGFIVKNISKDNLTGLNMKKHLKNIDELGDTATSQFQNSSIGNSSQNSRMDIKVDKGLFFDEYTLNGDVDLTIPKNGDTQGMPDFTGIMASQMDFRFIITLPLKPKMSNATTISEDGKTHEWRLELNRINNLQMTARVPKILNIALAGLLVVLLIAGITVWIILRRRRIGQNRFSY